MDRVRLGTLCGDAVAPQVQALELFALEPEKDVARHDHLVQRVAYSEMLWKENEWAETSKFWPNFLCNQGGRSLISPPPK